MTLGEFKKILTFKTLGGLKLPDNNEDLGILIKEAITSTALRVTPNTLISDDLTNDSVLRWINDIQFVRKPKAVAQDGDLLDIDEQLSYAIVYAVAKQYIRDENQKTIYENEYRSALINFAWSNYNFLEEIPDEQS